MNCKIISLDLDGTILKHDQNFTDKTIKTLKKLKSLNYILILNTGRLALNSLKVLKKFDLSSSFDYILGANGSEFYDIKNKEFKILGVLKPHNIKEINQKYIDEDISLCIYDKEFLLANKSTEFYQERTEALKLNTKVINFDQINNEYSKVLGIINPKDIEYFKNKIKNTKINGVDSFFSNTFLIEFVVEGISKISGLDYILKKLKKYNRNDILSFGDSANDIEMLKYTIGVRMGENNPILEKHTKYFTNSCDEDGFANYIENNLLNKG